MHFIAPTDRGNWQNLFSVFQQATTHQRFDLTLLRRDGSKLDARFLGVIRVSSVSDAFIWLMFVDISERRATEEHLSKLSLAVEQSPDSIMITNLDGVIEFVNPAFTLISGYSAEEVLGRNPRMLQSGLTPAETYRSLWQTLATGAIWQGEFINRRKDGLLTIEAATISPLRQPNGKITHYVSVQKDVTELKDTLNELITSRDRLRLAQEASGLGIFDRDISSGQLEWDAHTRGICGIEPDERIDFETFMALVHPDDREKIRAAIEHAIEHAIEYTNGKSTYITEYRIINRKTHEVRTLVARGRVFFEAGRATRILGTVQDVTAERTMEAELKNRRRSMDQLVDQQVAAQTAAAIAHEINQPLASISAYSEAALKMLDSGQKDKLEHALKGAVAQSQKAGQVLHELLEFLHSGEILPEPTNLNEVIHEALASVNDSGYGGFHTVIDLAPGLKPVLANRLQLQKVLINLITNGVDAMREAGVATAQITIRVRTEIENSLALTTILDSGPGIDADMARQIFNPFFTTKESGIGLGLAISRALIEAQGGRLWLDTNAGPGAVFHFTLPFAS
jgi:PAS domain S-box-containing protein